MSLSPLTNENNPLKKVKKGEINRPVIQSAFNAESVPAKETAQEIKSDTGIIFKDIKDPDTPPVAAIKPKGSNNTNYTLVIDKDQLFLLKALSTYENKTINSVLTEALSQYFNNINADTIKEAKALYTQLNKLLAGSKK